MAKLTLATFVTLCCALSVSLIQGQITGDSTLSYISGTRVRPFTNLQASDYFLVDGATVNIEFGYVPGQDTLLLDYEGAFGLTSTFQDGILFISGQAPVSEYSAAISTVIFYTTADDGQSRRITWTYGKNTFRMTLTGHYYAYTQYTGSWSAAQTSCQTNKYMNMQGYLANIDSANEMDEVGGAAQFSVWVGGSDSATEGTWTWVTGPKNGQQFWQGASMYQGGYAVNNSFTKWYRFQPDNGNGEGQNYMAIRPSVVPNSAYWEDDSNSDGVAGFVCEYGGMDSDVIARTMNDYAGTVVLAFDCGLYSQDAAGCQNHAGFGCTYNGAQCAQTDCTRHLTEQQCGADWKCAWNYKSYIGTCGNTKCGKFSDSTTCAADATCYQATVSGSSQCLNKVCAHATSAAECAGVDGCSWVAGQCGYDMSINCDQQDVVYMLDGSAALGSEWSRFTTGFQGLTDLFIESQPTLAVSATSFGQRIGFLQYGPTTMQATRDQIPPSSTGTGGTLTGSWSAAVADLRYQQARYSVSTGRMISSALSTAQTMLFPAGETTNRKKVLVIFAAGAIQDAVGAASGSVLASLKSRGVTILGAAIAPNAQPSNWQSQAMSSLQMLTPYVQGVSIDDVQQSVIYGTCTKNTTFGTAVLGSAGYPRTLCFMYMDSPSCMTNADCAWDTASLSCRRSSCLLNENQQSCSGTCVWDSTRALCKERCNGATQTDCTGACVWSNNQCSVPACLSNPTEDSCIADPNTCTYMPGANPPCQPQTCQTQTANGATACAAVSGCVWVNNKECVANTCGFNGQSTCTSDPRCAWSNTTNTCVFNTCGVNQNEVDCSQTTLCTWSVANAPGACIPAPCTKYNLNPQTAQMQCAADPKCGWGGPQIRCRLQECDFFTTAAGCSTMSTCVWRNAQCKDSRYVQCPAIDVVFAVEATPVMQLPFGRHPNGFYGIVEQLRQWSFDAPFSSNTDATGFRMKLFFYGANTAPAYPTSGFYPRFSNGQPAAGQPSWNGAGGELYSAEAAVAQYARGTGGNVKVRPALVAAKNLFAADNVTGRVQLVVILGNSAITDAGGDLGTAVADLESSGVQIFSNVIRRYSAITPNEQMAANYLSPLASDPMQSHFMFSTIDDLRAAFLDKFCDPSSGTGQVLNISRDGTLPCNWLSGATECQIQGSCSWNASATVTCPQSNQCPQFGCVALPAALAKKFTCENCKYAGGAFQCQAGARFVAPVGACQTAPCMSLPQSSCSGSCAWNVDKQRCDRAQCSYADVTSCNNDLACVWIDSGLTTTSGCRLSTCGLFRSDTTCSAPQTVQGSGASPYRTCSWQKALTPAICAESRCPNLAQTNCAAYPATCTWRIASGRQCQELTCQYTNNAQCEADAQCFWDHFDTTGKNCKERTGTCVMSGYSNWTQCSASCGPAVQYKARTIVAFPEPSQQTCQELAAAQGASQQQCNRVPNCEFPSDTSIVVSRSCSTSSSSCSTWCSSYGSNVIQCMNDVSCQWKNQACVPAPVYGCSTITTAASCNALDSCSWNSVTSFCEDTVKSCRNATTQDQCSLQSLNCDWYTGSDALAITDANGNVIPSQIVNPGQMEIFVFPTVRITSNDIISGAVVTIESNYSRGKDLLELTFPTSITSTWNAQAGTLYLSGAATVTEYSRAIRYVTFWTSSTNPAPRKITWSFRRNTVYSATTGHWYSAFWQSTSWDTAKANCANDVFFGLNGYLVTVNSDHENTLLFSKLSAEGWISGDDSSRNQWRYSTGASAGTAFWTGPSVLLGGYQNPGGFANWAPGQPAVIAAGFNHPYLQLSGLWMAQPGDYNASKAYVCEYSGVPTASYPISGAMIVGFGGCIPDNCIYHVNMTDCNMDSECAWIRGACVPGCNAMSSMSECERSANCKWDSTTVPPVCDINICSGLGETACNANSFACLWSPGVGCGYRSGCAMYTAQANCSTIPTCQWTTSTASCDAKPCESFGSEIACGQNALCQWNAAVKVCTSAICNYGTENQCASDRRCTWSSTQGVAAAFPPGGATVLPFTSGVPLTQDTNTNVDGMTVSIVEGFQMGQDMLSVQPSDNVAGNYKINYNKLTGVLTLVVVPGVSISRFDAFTFLQNSVRFSSTSNVLARRRLLYALSLRMTVSADKTKLFKYIPTTTPISSFSAATAACQQFGTQFGFTGGDVAQIMSQTDNLRLEALSAQGWLGGTVAAGTSSQWVWGATSLDPTIRTFWNGVGARGTPYSSGNFTAYAQWAGGEPKRGYPSSYAFFAQTGFWKVVNESSTGVQTGVICQYAVPTLQSVFGERNVMPSGCFLTPCLSVPKAQCRDSPQCIWTETESSGQCAQDTWCTRASNPDSCNMYELCFWDYDAGSCRTAAPNSCSQMAFTNCTQDPKCKWNTMIVPRNPAATGVCTFTGCGVHPKESPCTADPLCRWAPSSDGLGGTCVARLCGYQVESQCWTDKQCSWNRLVGKCQASPCLQYDQSGCTSVNSCSWDAVNSVCNYVRCGTGLTGAQGKLTCQTDSACLWNSASGTCSMPACNQPTETACKANPQCYFTYQPNRCLAAQCTSNTNLQDCEQGVTQLSRKPCIWEAATSTCRQLTFAEQNAPESSPNTCVKESYGDLWWLWVLAGLCLLLIIGIFYRLYLAYAKGLSFFEPAKKTKQFSPHAQFGEELFEEAQQTGQETNINAKYTRPTADEL